MSNRTCGQAMRPCFNVMAKPVGPACNLACTYCYYVGKQVSSPGEAGVMDEALLELFIRSYIREQTHEVVTFSWQGGEPTLSGLDFFRKALNLQERYRRPGQIVVNNLQTNGMLLDDDWCVFLSDNGFLVGLSVDGPAGLHDAYRRDLSGRPTCDRVVAAARRLREHRVAFNTLTVVNRTNARYPVEVYEFLRDEVGSAYIQFIPCVERKNFAVVAPQCWDVRNLPAPGEAAARPGAAGSVVTDWSVDPDDYGDFLCSVFDRWYARDIGRVFVITFEVSLNLWMNRPSPACSFAETCGRNVVLERNGDVYACDHYVYPEYRLGNMRGQTLSDMVSSARQERFGLDKSAALPRYCRECSYLFACHGECPKNRFLRTPDGEPGLNYLCAGFRKYFTHIDGPMKTWRERLS